MVGMPSNTSLSLNATEIKAFYSFLLLLLLFEFLIHTQKCSGITLAGCFCLWYLWEPCDAEDEFSSLAHKTYVVILWGIFPVQK